MSAIPKLTARQGKLLDGIAQLKTPVQAAREAGYSESYAKTACRILRGANVCGEFHTLLRGFVDVEKIGQRLAEGLDATETRFCQHQGIITDERQLVNWSERREYVLAAAKLTGYYVDKPEIAVAPVPSAADDEKRIAELLAIAVKREEELARSKPTN